jgi:hypothetical protein
MRRNGYLASVLLALVFLASAATAQQVKINEAYSRGTPGDLDWIEVYNTTAADIDISGYMIYDNGGLAGSKPKRQFPAGTILPAKGFVAMVTDTAAFDGDESGFGLSSGGETIWLEDAAGALIDSSVIPACSVDTSWARVPDGADTWMKVQPRTKGSSNVLIKMNECYSRGTAGALDWIEIYNAAAADMDISGYKIYDSGGQSGSKPKKEFPAGTVIPASGYYVIITDTASFDGDESGFGLSSGGETVWLENAAGVVIDIVDIPALGVDTSFQRVPDGSNMIVKKSPLTRGATNGSLTSVRGGAAADGFVLHQNYPNPFNPATTITYTLATRGAVTLKVYNLLGREVAELVRGVQAAGEHVALFDARDLPSGMYFYTLQTGNTLRMRKMTLLK